MSLNPPVYADIQAAAERLKGQAVRTPLIENAALNEKAGGRVLIKAECLQRTGSFKFRGAYNRISQLTPEQRQAGVVAYSSGNHAQGAAAASKIIGCPAIILMPLDAPTTKVEGVKFWGGEVRQFDRATENREEIGARLAEERGAVLVPPYEHNDIIVGQGTAGLEAVEQMAEIGATPDLAICCAGGGGLIAGVGLAVKHHHPQAEIWAAEPEEFDDHRRSVASGRRERNDRLSGSICDAIITPTPGELTWALNSHQLSGGYAVSEDEVLDSMAFAFRHLKLVIEPGGAAALAAVTSGKAELDGRTVLVLATGGNVDKAMFERALARL